MDPIYFKWKEKDVHALTIFSYGDKVKSLLYQFKGCGDIELANVFFGYPSIWLRVKYRGYHLVLAPSSKSHDEARGFNQVAEMVKCLHKPVIDCLEKRGESKQSDLSAEERKRVGRSLFWKKGASVKGKKILLVDDVFTTGSTARACLDLIKRHGARKIRLLVMAKTPWKNP